MKTVDFNLTCAHCEAPLEGTSLNGTCGKCGVPVEATIDITKIDENGTLEHNVSCIRCGYNLRSLRVSGICPECGRPVHNSLRSNALWLANPSWRRGVQEGIGLLLLSGIGMPAVLLAGGLIVSDILPMNAGIAVTVVVITLIIFGLLAIGGVLCISACEKTPHAEARRFWPHNCAGVLLLFSILWTVLFCVIGLPLAASSDSLGGIIVGFSLLVLFACLLLSIAAIIACLRRIAARANAPRLRTATLWWLPSTLGVVAVCIAGFLFAPLLTPMTHQGSLASELLDGFALVAGCGLYILALVGLGMYYRLLAKAHIRFTAAAESLERPQKQDVDAA